MAMSATPTVQLMRQNGFLRAAVGLEEDAQAEPLPMAGFQPLNSILLMAIAHNLNIAVG
jgi:hypothetical protein